MSSSSARAWLRFGLIVAVLVAALLLTWNRFAAPSGIRSSAKEVAGAPGVGKVAPFNATADPLTCGPTDEVGGGKFVAAVAARVRREDALAKVNAFTNWLTAWRRSDAAAQPSLVASGLNLAVARRGAMKYLIESDPQRALDVAISPGLRRELPEDIAAQIEQRVDGRGEFDVSIIHAGTEARRERSVLIGDTRYQAFVFGRREQQLTKIGLPLHGIAIENLIALEEMPYRLLDDGEKSQHGQPPDAVTVTVGGKIMTLAHQGDLQRLNEALVEAESKPGPYVVEKPSATSDTPWNSLLPPTAAVTSPPSWINGAKRVLWVKIDFSDDPGGAFTDAEITTTSTAVNEFYVANSQDKTSMVFTTLPAVIRMPRDKAYYNNSGSTLAELQDAAKVAAKQYDAANGGTGAHDPDRYDRWIILTKRVPAYTFGGVAQLGGPRVVMNNSIAPGTTGHELGHTQSLDHSHYWLPAGNSGVGGGAHVEYGDVFDIMGSSSSSPNNHFNVAQKTKLGYLDGASVTTVAQAGTYRIARHDHRDAAGIRGLKIAPADLGYEYWVEHRRFGPTAFNAAQLDRLRNGVLLHWGPGKSPKFTTGAGTYLVDATPGSAGAANDGALRIGETFVDPDAGITVKPLAVGGTAPNEYIDVQVAFGAIDGNRNPTLQADLPPGAIAARTNVIFNASGSDPDADPVYFRWDFGDAQIQPNLSNITRRFSKGGAYTLRVSAHDGKGGIATRSLPFNVVDPLVSWTRRAAGLTANFLGDVIFANGMFVVVGDNVIATSPDGANWTRASGWPTGHTFRGMAHSGARFAAVALRAGSTTERGGAVYSDNGTNWIAATVPAGTGQMLAITHGAGRFVAVGELGRIYTSTDGVTWITVASPVTNTLRSVTFGNNTFVIAGDGGRILTSSDGLTWENRSLATTASVFGATRYNNLWYATTGSTVFYTSPDAVTWTRVLASPGTVNTINLFRPIAGVLIATCNTNGSIAFAENIQSWATHQLDATANTNITGVAEGNGAIVAVGSRGLIFSTSQPAQFSAPLAAPSLRNEADSLKVSVGKANVLAASGTGFTRLELYANGTKVSELTGSAGALSWTPTTIGNYSLVVRGIDASGASVVAAAVPAIAGLSQWNVRNPQPAATDLNSAVRVGDKWWIVGRCGSFLTLDSNGVFTPVDFPTTQNLASIAYGNGRFVIGTPFQDSGAKEDIGAFWTSPDGYAWTALLTDTLTAANINFVTFASETWLALGTGGTLMTSTDAINWTRRVSGTTSSLRGGTYGNGLWVAVGAGGRIITSLDTATWTERSSGVTTDLYSVAFNGTTFVVTGLSGVILASSDGITWTRQSSGVTTNLYSVGVVKGSFVVVGDVAVTLVSSNGTTWTAASMDGKFSNALFVAGSGDDGLILGRAGEVYTATAVNSWRRVNQGTGETKFSVIYAGGRFVAVGQTTDAITRVIGVPIATSTDGITWVRANPNSAFTNVNDVAFSAGTYVTVGDSGRIFTSLNASVWVQRTSGFTGQLFAVAGGAPGFVAGGAGGAVLSSPDGTTWTTRASGASNPLRAAAFGNGRYVIVGDSGAIIHSTDGSTWSTASSGVTTGLLTIGWWEEFGFIAAGNSGTMVSSIDGITWQQVETGVADTIAAIAKTPIGLLASGGINGTLLLSLDGANWSLATLPADRMIRGIASSASAIVGVGDQGAMLTFELVDSTPLPAIMAHPASQSTVLGASVVLTVNAQHTSGAVFQWMKEGVPIIGANTPNYSIPAMTDARAGSYTIVITNPTGSVTSSPAMLSLASASDPGRLVNLSILTSLNSRDDTFTFGVVVGGAGTVGSKSLLVRAVGPSLTALGVSGVLDDPKLEFFTGAAKAGENDNWGGADSTRTAMAQVGAFPFASGSSRDAAIFLPSLVTGASSAKISGTGAGTVIAELYDATPAGAFTLTTPRLVNVSVLKHIGSGVTAGFVIGGSTSRTVLVRAIGPTLGAPPFNVGGVVADPQLSLFIGQTQIAANDNWGGTSALTAAFNQVGAFSLPATSRDAALLIELQPGSYTVQVGGAGGGTGVGLIEVYEVP